MEENSTSFTNHPVSHVSIQVSALPSEDPAQNSLAIGSVRNPEQHLGQASTELNGSKPTIKYFQCFPLSVYKVFVGLGKVLTGYHLTVVFPKLTSFTSQVSSSNNTAAESTFRNPFENLEEETDCYQNETQTVAETVGTSAKTSQTIRVKFQLPIFIILISVSQWAFFHFAMNDTYGGWISSNLQFNPFRRYEIWRFITATWIHGTALHLRGNLRVQLIAGCCLEIVHGWKRVGILYFSGVISANLTISVFEPLLIAYGASGGVYALITGHLATNIMNWNETWGASNRCLLLIIYLGLSALAAFNKTVEQHVLPAHHLIGHLAHAGGALIGFVVGFCVLKNFRKRPWEIKTAKYCLYATTVIFIMALGANIGDQIFFWKSIEFQRQKKLLIQHLLNNKTIPTSTIHSNDTNSSSYNHPTPILYSA